MNYEVMKAEVQTKQKLEGKERFLNSEAWLLFVTAFNIN